MNILLLPGGRGAGGPSLRETIFGLRAAPSCGPNDFLLGTCPFVVKEREREGRRKRKVDGRKKEERKKKEGKKEEGKRKKEERRKKEKMKENE